jgi:Rad3-related DNA helicase
MSKLFPFDGPPVELNEAFVLGVFSELKLTPRENQASTVLQILTEFSLNRKQYVVLNAPTGSGKSIIGMVVSECLSKLHLDDLLDNFGNRTSLFLMHQNMLLAQYQNTFTDKYRNLTVLGASNYECAVMTKKEGAMCTAEKCVHTMLLRTGHTDILEGCNGCTYLENKIRLNASPHVFTNYSFKFTSRKLQPRLVTVLDEAHVVNDVYVNHVTLEISDKVFQKIIQAISPYKTLSTKLQETQELKSAYRKLEIAKAESDFSYLGDFLAKFHSLTGDIGSFFEGEAALYATKSTIKEYYELKNLESRFKDLSDKTLFYLTASFEPIVEFKEDVLTLKPLFMETLFEENFNKSKFVLLMSATISDYLVQSTCKVNPQNISFVNMESSFPQENKELIIFDSIKMNYASLQQKETIDRIKQNVKDILSAESGKRGVILTPSFKVNEMIAELCHKLGYTTFEQRSGQKLADVLEAFKSYSGSALLISPSAFEGVDLPGQLSEFQIIVKAPFASLADKRIAKMADKFPAVYELYTLMKVVQGCGRSVRGPTDKAAIYVFDSNIKRLWFNKLNVWESQFTVTNLS